MDLPSANVIDGLDRDQARLPADQGLGSLGLLMQLGGSLGMAAAVAIAIPAAMSGDRESSVLFFFAVLYGVRAAFHRIAGSAVLYGTGGDARRSVLTYVWVAACHALVTLFLLQRYLDTALLVRLAGLLLAWPIVLLLCASLPRLERLLARTVPSAEDHGFEGAAVLMTVLGSAGVSCAAVLLVVLLELPLPSLGLGDAADLALVLAVAVCGLCLVRSVSHLRAGVRATTGAGFEAHQAHVARYGAVGNATAGAAAVLLAAAIAVCTGNLSIVLIAGICARAALGAWPAALRRLHAERSFDRYLAGDRGPVFRRAPDTGLTALGWLLVALGAPAFAQGLAASVLAGAGADAAWPVELGLVSLGHGWRTLLASGLQLWAGIALLGMRAHARRITAAYALVAVSAALGSATLTLGEAFALGAGALDGALQVLALLARLAGAGIEMAVPCAALWLVERPALPRAVALTPGRRAR